MNNSIIIRQTVNENSPLSVVIDDKLYMFENRKAVISELNRLCDEIEFLCDHIVNGVKENQERVARGEAPIKEISAPVLHICNDGFKENVAEKIACGFEYCCFCGAKYIS
jgi:hypothetical protein